MAITKENFGEFLFKPEIIDRFCSKLCEHLMPKVEEKLSEMKSSIVQNMANLSAKIADFERNMKAQRDNISKLESDNTKLENRVRELERYSRQDNLIFHGIPYQRFSDVVSASNRTLNDSEITFNPANNHNTVDDVINFVRNVIKVPIEKSDISVAHRLASRSNSNATAAPSASNTASSGPIIVKFNNKDARHKILTNRKILKGQAGTYINEHLSILDADIYRKCRKLVTDKKLFKCWTYNGVTMVKKSSNVSERPLKINNLSDLAGFN